MGFAEVRSGEKSAKAAARFLEHHVLPVYREAGIELVEVVVDGGPEFKGEFARTCRRLGIAVHRLPPRSPDLNAFVERFQGTVLHLHYRTAFRYRFYTSATSTTTSRPGCGSTTSSDLTGGTGPRGVVPRRCSTRTPPRFS